MIEQTRPLIYSDGEDRAVLSVSRAVLSCGCMAVVGKRIDNGEQACAAIPCSEEHRALTARFHALMTESLRNPQDRRTVVVADELLQEAANV